MARDLIQEVIERGQKMFAFKGEFSSKVNDVIALLKETDLSQVADAKVDGRELAKFKNDLTKGARKVIARCVRDLEKLIVDETIEESDGE